MKHVMVIIILVATVSSAIATDEVFLTILLRAAPGELPTLIELIQDDITNHQRYGIKKPYLMRHSQGDQWDLMFIVPIGRMSDFYDSAQVRKRKESNSMSQSYDSAFFDHVAHYEELFVTGPSYDEFKVAFESFDFYHVEMFVAVPGKRSELKKQREMENVYYLETNRRPNMIFVREAGSAWDVFTVGFYEDLENFAGAGRPPIPKDVKEKAAREAGFKDLDHISFYLRELIAFHHDTLANAVK